MIASYPKRPVFYHTRFVLFYFHAQGWHILMNVLTLLEIYILWLLADYNQITKRHLLDVTFIFGSVGLYLNVNTIFVHSMRMHLFLDMVLMVGIIALLTVSFKKSMKSFQNAMLLAALCVLGPIFLQDILFRDIVPALITYQGNYWLVDFLVKNVGWLQLSLFTLGTVLTIWVIKLFKLGNYVFHTRIGHLLFSLTILLSLTLKLPADYLKFGDKLTFMEIVFSTVVVFIVIFLSFKILKKYDDEVYQAHLMRKQQEISEANQRYVSEIEHSYQNIRKLQHDYDNNLLVLAELIRHNNISEAKQYLTDIQITTDMNHTKMSPHLIQLQHIENNDVKNVFLVKLLHVPDNVQMHIEVPEDITISPSKSSTVTRCMGIILDNALEELDAISGGTLSIALLKKENSLIFEISNSCAKSTPPVHELMALHYSTKGVNRGYGLTNLQDIVENATDMFLDTHVTDEIFTQTLVLMIDTGDMYETNFDM